MRGVASESPFHEGEQRVQQRLGVRDEIEPWARRVVRPYLPDEHRAFYAQLPFLVLAARDAGCKRVFVPTRNSLEAALAPNVEIHAVANLS